ncbi:hypothetical protein ACQ1XD_004667 [Pseudomonas aeruginosa]|uniref:hypothetical protein n=1 Tax=Pseudomonas aeruginosa TaxID=287 RepID=UPI00071BAA75|nr:hypothetical protein [Pseudomonas aeruginosa]EKD1543853.1 hypothetical protein [Pseudomonas aeruginosa]EKV8096513.1 hypothetical protein [Pseudomonas aeruginosa]EKW6729915.1 hypothetical protein [Pseudomonas aeruginosa]ELD6232359.1 hypothetical protein [Pseudomonas aeruginosa]ELK3536738.1 hypothetical protein [Pseudomonas aeruginosa]
MAVPIDSIQVGRVFDFPGGARRVVKLSPPLGTGFNVEWEYADGQKRQGKHGGSQWVHYFRRAAKRELVVDGPGGQTRALRTSEVVPVLDAAIDVSIHTTCPRKWAFVDLETGEVWKHDGQAFIRASTDEVKSITRALGGC